MLTNKTLLAVFVLTMMTCTAMAQACQAGFIYSVNTVSNTVTFTNTSTSSPGSSVVYFWNFGDGDLSAVTSPTHTYITPGTYTVSLTIFSAGTLCSSTTTSSITVGTTPCFAAFNSAINHANPLEVAFANSSTGTALSYQWHFGDGSTSTLQDPSHTYSTNGMYYVTLVITGSNGCFDSTGMMIDTRNAPSGCDASFTNYVDSLTGTAYFSANTFDTINLKYFWDFGDGTYSTALSEVHQYSSNGLYVVCLTLMQDDSLCSDMQCDTVEVFSPVMRACSAEFETFNDSVLNTFYFSANSFDTLNTSYYWSFGDGSTGYGPYASHTYTSDGVYSACLNVVSNDSTCWDYLCTTIVISNESPCEANFSYSILDTASVTFFANSFDTTNLQYFWSFGDGTNGYGPATGHEYAAEGAYFVCLTIKSYDSLCWDSYCDTVFVRHSEEPACDASFFMYADPADQTVYCYANSADTSTTSYFWDFGDSTYGYTPYESHNYETPGTYMVCLTVSGYYNGCTSSYCQYIEVGRDSTTSCDASFNYYIEPSTGMVSCYANSADTSTTSYFWDFGDGTYGYTPYESHIYEIPGSYTVCLTVSGYYNGCNSTYCQYIEVGRDSTTTSCDASFFSYVEPTTGMVSCYANSFDTYYTSYFWDFGDGSTETGPYATHQYSTDGTYLVCLTVTSNDSSCWDMKCDSVHVGQYSGCDASFTYEEDSNSTYIFMPAQTSEGTSYYWSFDDDSIISTDRNPAHYFTPGFHTVCLTVRDETGSCVASWCDSILTGRTTGIKEVSDITISNAYPVPFNEELKLDLSAPATTSARVTLVDLTGHTVLEQQVAVNQNGNTLSFDTRNLSKGIYFINIVSEYGHTVKKLCK